MIGRPCFASVAALSALLLPKVAHAHFLWISQNGSTHTFSIGFQETPFEDAIDIGTKLNDTRLVLRTKQIVPLTLSGTWLTGKVDQDVVGASLDYGVLDRSDQGRGVFWLQYYAKAATSVEGSQRTLGLPVEVSAKKDGKNLIVTVTKDGKPVPNADVIAFTKDAQSAAKTEQNGSATVPDPGSYVVIRAAVVDATKGKKDGQSYDMIRSYCTLQVGTPPQQRSLTSLIHEAFGNRHDIVGRTAFIQTLTSGKLTRPQLVAHLDQRAIIHERIEPILESLGGKLPYGPQQKEVLTLLKKDMEAMHEAWPTAERAWPLTKELLEAIETHSAKSPYFALGVFHVYYGGITHGGRDIGKMIESQTGVGLTYYSKSDGYADYVMAINKITNPADRQEVIDGGLAAYDFIIKSSDADVFKSR